MRAEGVALVVELLADQRVHARGQVAQRLGGTTHDLGDHGVDGYGFFQLVVLHQERLSKETASSAGGLPISYWLSLANASNSCCRKPRSMLRRFMRRSRMASKSVLFGVAGRAIGDLEERVIGVVEQRLQRLTQLLGGLVAHADERHRKAACR